MSKPYRILNRKMAVLRWTLRHNHCRDEEMQDAALLRVAARPLSTSSVNSWSRKALGRERDCPTKIKEMQHNGEREIPTERQQKLGKKD